MLTNRPFRTLLVGVFLTHTLAAVSAAQSFNAEPGPVIDIERAVRLETQAEALIGEPGKYRKAARMLRDAARLRPDEDRRALASLGTAGVLSHHAKDFHVSRALLVEQAERALRVGEVGIAANAYIDAAWAAIELKDGRAALEYIETARMLGTSSMLSPPQRKLIAIRTRVEPPVVAAKIKQN